MEVISLIVVLASMAAALSSIYRFLPKRKRPY